MRPTQDEIDLINGNRQRKIRGGGSRTKFSQFEGGSRRNSSQISRLYMSAKFSLIISRGGGKLYGEVLTQFEGGGG